MSSQLTNLQNEYNILNQERNEIEKVIKQNETLNSAYINGNLYVSSNYYNYIVYLFIALFLIFLLIHLNFSQDQYGGSKTKLYTLYPFIFIILGLIIIFNAIKKN